MPDNWPTKQVFEEKPATVRAQHTLLPSPFHNSGCNEPLFVEMPEGYVLVGYCDKMLRSKRRPHKGDHTLNWRKSERS